MATRSKAEVVQDRSVRPKTLREDFAVELRALVLQLDTVTWPSPRWRDDPVDFAKTVLGLTLIPHQVEILEAVRDNSQTAVRSGHKIGKTLVAVILALWWYATRPDARVVVTATTANQIDRVFFREFRKRHRGALIPIDGVLGELARTGLKSHDFREVVGFTAREVEAVAGVSGADLLYIVDEASSLSTEIYEAIQGNLASGSGRILMISNPTKTEGPFFEVFHHKSDGWKVLHYSSEDIARSLKGREVPGVASLQRIERWKADYGEESVFYRVRVRGEFIVNELGKGISLQLIEEAQERFEETPDDHGLTTIGIDPAGPGAGGDETAYAIVRGPKLVHLQAFHGLDEDNIIEHLMAFLRTHRRGDEIPQVIVDIEGPIGSSLVYKLHPLSADLLAKRPREAFRVYGVKASNQARREPLLYDRTRDELFANLANWMKTGAIPRDHKLEIELHTPEWTTLVNGKLKITPKDNIRATIGRSPDRSDALALAVWNPAPWLDAPQVHSSESTGGSNRRLINGQDVYALRNSLDPYSFYDQAVGRR